MAKETQKKEINVEIDWDELDKFWADQYEGDYGQYFSKTLDASASKSKGSADQPLPQYTKKAIPLVSP